MEISNSVLLTIACAEELEATASALQDKAYEIRRAHGSVIRLKLHDDGLISITAWKRGRPDSGYAPLTLERALNALRLLVQELQLPESPLSPDTDAR